MIYYFECEYCGQRVGITTPETKAETLKLDCPFCGGKLPLPTTTSLASRPEDAPYVMSSYYVRPNIMTTTGELVQPIGFYHGEPVFEGYTAENGDPIQKQEGFLEAVWSKFR